jgi:hypothetical protein
VEWALYDAGFNPAGSGDAGLLQGSLRTEKMEAMNGRIYRSSFAVIVVVEDGDAFAHEEQKKSWTSMSAARTTATS